MSDIDIIGCEEGGLIVLISYLGLEYIWLDPMLSPDFIKLGGELTDADSGGSSSLSLRR